MPWDGTTLFVSSFRAEGETGTPRPVAGGREESIFQPSFSPGGRLTFVSDRSGWWNLYQERESGIVALCNRMAEFGLPQWVFGMSTYGFVDEETMLCVYRVDGIERLARLELQQERLVDLSTPHSSFDGLAVAGRRACFIGAGATTPPAVCSLDLETNRIEELCRSFEIDFDPGFLSEPEAIEFASESGRSAYAFLYRPRHPQLRAAAGERPPLIVKSHGGPTAATSSALKLGTQYWTSRGFAVADVNYGGSTGYGRAYRERLRGAWGVVDVDDCAHAALFASSQGLADPERLAVSGGSAGGYTTLCALTFREVFAAGASHYGVGDLEALARDTHKFESRYLDGLVGPYPERRDLYIQRSPIHHAARLSCPVIFFQGLEDRIVPPNQAEEMVEALAARGIAHAYVPFEGEQHGFRRAENIRTALEGELFFYAHVFGFSVDVRPPAVRIVG
jgi:dipeptidyl aminopeptidase/acylaminoacyl peptidase